ncbi:hypothetical protein SLS53_002546 [Cytospora paraplurivora]|uniref:Uncharacterized protein n=1 Tax=Cytospora paraplurivora TaxID=2898453 RepID=A0AAN9UKC0_9PEZI
MAAGGVVGFVIIIGILIMLHLRRNRVEREEFSGDTHELSDWGLDDYPSKGGKVGGYPQQPGQAKKRRLSEHELTAAENPFGLHSDLATAEKMSATKNGGPPPRYPDAVKM